MSNKKTVTLKLIDREHYTRFKTRDKQKIGLPECILEEYNLTPKMTLSDEKELAPLRQYKNAEGFEFTWGHILERRTDKYIVWDFCFHQLLSHYHCAGKRLSDLQRAFYYSLECRVSCATRDIVPVLSMQEGWKIIPCSAVGVFSAVINFTQEKEAREWIVDDLLCVVIPPLIEKLQNDGKKVQC